MSDQHDMEKRMAAGMAKHMAQSLESSEGGVDVTFSEGKYGIHFPYNTALMRQIKSINGAAFDKETKAWTVPLTEYDAIRDAVSSMRVTLKAQTEARADMVEKIKALRPEATIRDAFANDNSRESGPIMLVNEFYVAQDRGNGLVKLHDRAKLNSVPVAGEDKSIFYKGGRGIVQERRSAKEAEGGGSGAGKRGAEASM